MIFPSRWVNDCHITCFQVQTFSRLTLIQTTNHFAILYFVFPYIVIYIMQLYFIVDFYPCYFMYTATMENEDNEKKEIVEKSDAETSAITSEKRLFENTSFSCNIACALFHANAFFFKKKPDQINYSSTKEK